MSRFAEPSVTLCGEKAPDKYAVCTRYYPHDGEHEFESFIYVQQRLDSTFTPCKWHTEFMARVANGGVIP